MALLESSSAGVTAAIVAAVVMAILGLLVAVWFWVRRMALRALEEAKKTARGTLLAADPMASYVARTDRGIKQAKGNAALVRSEQTLVCLRWVPRELTVLERNHVKGARLTNQFGSRWLPGKLRILVLDIERPGERFSIGFMPRQAPKWLEAIEAWRGKGGKKR
jgi:hypothetical protein